MKSSTTDIFHFCSLRPVGAGEDTGFFAKSSIYQVFSVMISFEFHEFRHLVNNTLAKAFRVQKTPLHLNTLQDCLLSEKKRNLKRACLASECVTACAVLPYKTPYVNMPAFFGYQE